jgi:hypothetical protein
MTAPADFIRSPIGIAVLMVISSVGGGWLKDRLTTETRDTASETRIEALEHRFTEHLTDAVSRRQYEENEMQTSKRLDEIRADIRDLKIEVETALRPDTRKAR